MVQPKRVEAEPVQPAVLPAPEDFARLLNVADASSAHVDSPARRLQQELEASFAEPQVRRWPAAARVGFVVGASAALWAVIITGALALI